MKLVLFILLFSINTSFGANCQVSKSALLNCANESPVCSRPTACNRKHSDCINLPENFNCETFIEKQVMIDDPSKPIWASRSMVESCSGLDECSAMKNKKDGLESSYSGDVGVCVYPRIAYRNSEDTEVWCNTITGYEQISSGISEIAEDETKKLTYDEAKAAEAAKDAAIKFILKAMTKGREVIAIMGIRNNAKGLSTAQVKQFLNTFGDIKAMLESGALTTAKEEIEAITPDAIITTQEDKDAILAEINSFLGL